jgi:hypothetical protein
MCWLLVSPAAAIAKDESGEEVSWVTFSGHITGYFGVPPTELGHGSGLPGAVKYARWLPIHASAREEQCEASVCSVLGMRSGLSFTLLVNFLGALVVSCVLLRQLAKLLIRDVVGFRMLAAARSAVAYRATGHPHRSTS